MGGGRVRARGKVWPKGETEPAAWTIERIDPIGSLKGAPGLYADAPSQAGGGSELYYDNIKVYQERGNESGLGLGRAHVRAIQQPML